MRFTEPLRADPPRLEFLETLDNAQFRITCAAFGIEFEPEEKTIIEVEIPPPHGDTAHTGWVGVGQRVIFGCKKR